jgi:two-component system, NarL family, sensor histidine kinase DevS
MDLTTEAVLKLARVVLERLDVEMVLERLLESARELTGARYAALGVLNESGTGLGRFLTLGIDDSTRRLIGPLPTGRGVLGELIRDPRPLRLSEVGSHPFSYGFPAGHPPMRTFLGVPILIDGRPYGNLYLTEKQGGADFTDDDEQSATLLAEFAGVAIDHARRYRDSESQRIELEHTVSALDATIQIARTLGGQTKLSAILELVAKRGRALVSARSLVIELLEGDELELAAGAGELPAGLIGRRVSLESTVAGAALRSGVTQRLSDHLNRARFEQHGLGNLGLNSDDGLVVPLIFRDRRFGVLVAVDHLHEGDFTAEHQRLLESFAASAATAVATAHSAANEQRRQRLAAAEAERARWARELHDETLQALGSLRLVLSAGARAGEPEKMTGAIEQSLQQLELDIANLRGLITELRPAALDQLGLEPAVLALVDRFRASGLDVDAHVELAFERQRDLERLVPELETGIYRIIQEALTNAVKHGDAARAAVELVEGEQTIQVSVRDDGKGFDPTAATKGFGLLGMRERVELLNGELLVESAPGDGTQVTVSLPPARVSEQPRETSLYRLNA